MRARRRMPDSLYALLAAAFAIPLQACLLIVSSGPTTLQEANIVFVVFDETGAAVSDVTLSVTASAGDWGQTGQTGSDGLFTCPHTGVALAALTKLAARGEVTRYHRVVVISTASGLKFVEGKVGYHEGRLADAPAPRFRNQPVELPERYEAVRDALHAGLS